VSASRVGATAGGGHRGGAPRHPPAPTAAPALGTLELGAPPEAALTVDGASVGRGSWVSDSVAPGRHLIRAVLPAVPGCVSADSALSIDLAPGERKVVRLRPVRCGRLLVDDVSPAPARFVLRAVRGAFERDGTVPFPAPLVVPRASTHSRWVCPAAWSSTTASASSGTAPSSVPHASA
jgi:hypothetical protein